MKKVFIIYFYVIFLLFSLISPFIFVTSNVNNFNKVNSNFLYLQNLKNNDVFKDLSYSDLNKYDIQSSLILRQDYFMQDLAPSNYAFSFGIETPFYSGVSVDKNDINYWFKKIILTTLKDDFYLTWWNQSQNGNNPNPYNQFYWKPDKGSSVSEAIGFKILFNGIKYKFTLNMNALHLFFVPFFANQSPRNFDLNFLMFNFNYRNVINLNNLKQNNFKFYVNDKLTDNFNDLDLLFKLLDYFYSNILRTLFDVSNYKEYLIFTSLTGNLGFSFFVKNGFLLYPKSMLFNFWVSNGTDPQYQVKLANAFKINSNDNYYSYLSNWDYLTDVLPGNGNGGYESKVKMLDMTIYTNKYRGFNIITFQSKNLPSKSTLNLFGFNFSIYNASDWNNEINGGDIWNLPYSSCTWYNVFCHIKNGFIWAFNNLPGIKEVGKYANALVNTMQNVNLLWDNISNFFAFDIAFKLLLGAIITLAMFNGILRFL